MLLLHWVVVCSLAGGPTADAVLVSAPGGPLRSLAPQSGLQAKAGNSTVEGDAYYYFVLGRHRESDGDVDGAIKAYQQAAALDPRSAEIRAELSALYARQNRAREATEWADAALKLDGGNAEANRVLGMVYASLARLDEPGAPDAEAVDSARKAIQRLEAARKRSATLDPGIEMMLARLYLRTGNGNEAITTLRRLVEQEPERGEPIALLAQAYEQVGRGDEATSLLEQSVSEHPEFYATLGELYENQREWKSAADAYQHALERNPRSVELKTRLAVSLLSNGGRADAGRAASALQEVRQQNPADGQVLYLLAQAQRLSGKLDDAETTAKQLMAVAPASVTGPYALAQVYDQKQQYRRVVETLEPVVKKSQAAARNGSEMAPLVLMLASAHEELGAFDQALAAFARARQIAPDSDNIDLYELGTLVTARRFPEALDRSKALLATHPGDQRVVRLRAEALRGAGKTAEAVQVLKDALAQQPEDVSAHLALSEMYAATHQYEPAVTLLHEAARKFPSDLTVRFQLGSVLERQGKVADAERAFREVLAKDPLYAPALNYLGYMLADRGDRLDESIALIKRALQVEPYNGAYLDSLGWAYFKANRLELAEQNLAKAADQRARDSAVQDHFGDLLFRLGRYTDAAAAWRRALDGDGEQVNRSEIDRKLRMASEKVARQ